MIARRAPSPRSRRRAALAFGALLLAAACGARAPVERPETARRVRWQVDLERPRRLMQGGLGASWHALSREISVRADELRGGAAPLSARGSAWGGNPPLERRELWQQLRRHATWLGLSWLRVEMAQSMYQPERGGFDFESDEMRALDAILDWCDASGAEVLLAQMWSGVEWNRFPGLHAIQSGPRALEPFADGLAAAVEHLVRTRGHRSIRWLSIVNEPNLRAGWWLGGDGLPLPLSPALAAVRRALDRRALDLPLAAPDWNRLREASTGQYDWESDAHTGAFVLHNYEGPRAAHHMARWVARARARGVPFFLGEMGDFRLGWGGSSERPKSFDAQLSLWAQVAAGVELGADGFNRWSFTNRGDLDGQWQLVRTWDREARRYLDRVEPEPVPYFTFALLARYWANRSTALATLRSADPEVSTAAILSPRGELTLFVANAAREPVLLELALAHAPAGRTLYRYRVVEAALVGAVRLDPEPVAALAPGGAELIELLPARSVAAYSTYRLRHEDPGVVEERVAPSPPLEAGARSR